jgi:formate dehydrogenase major subunit
LEQDHSVTYPCEKEGDPGDPVIFTDGFPTASGRAKFVPAKFSQADELPDKEFPFVFITGRQLEHWHTGSMTRRTETLDAIEPVPVISVHPSDLAQLGVAAGTTLTVQSRRGQLTAFARGDQGVPEGNVYMAFAYNEAAANLITTDMLDPFGKIPEFKFCAVKLSAGGDPAPRLV